MSSSFAQNQMNYFVMTTQLNQIKKAFAFICKTQFPKQGQKILDKYKNKSNFPLLLSNLLDYRNQPQINSKILAALQLKKIENICQEQCWWILSSVYLCQNQKLSHIVKGIFLKQNHIKYLRPLLKQNFKGKDQMQKIRILSLFYCIIFNKNELIATQFVYQYFFDILDCLIQIGKDQIQFQIVAQLTTLNFLGLLSSCNIYNYNFDVNWPHLLGQIKCKNRNSITKTLTQIINIQLDPQSINHYDFNAIQNAINICLKRTAKICLFQQNMHYYNLLNIIDIYFFKKNALHQQQLIGNILNIYQSLIQKTLNKTIMCLQQQREDQQEEKNLKQRYCILQSLINNLNILFIKNLCKQFEINMLQFSLMIPEIVKTKNITQTCLIDVCDQIHTMISSPNSESIERQKYIISVTFKYISRYRETIPLQFLLNICYCADLIAIKIQSLSQICYEIIEILSEELLSIQTYKLIQFLNISLKNINNNIWGHNQKSYLFVFKVLLHINDLFWLNVSEQLNRSLMKMIEIIGYILNNNYNHQLMQNLIQFLDILALKDSHGPILSQISEESCKNILKLYLNYEQTDFIQNGDLSTKSVFIKTLYDHFKKEQSK